MGADVHAERGNKGKNLSNNTLSEKIRAVDDQLKMLNATQSSMNMFR